MHDCHLAAVFHAAHRLDQSEASSRQLKARAQQLYDHHLVQRRVQEHNVLPAAQRERMQQLIESLLPLLQPQRKVQKASEASTPTASSSSPPPSAPSRELLDAVTQMQQLLQTDSERPAGMPNKFWQWMEEHNHAMLLDDHISRRSAAAASATAATQRTSGQLAVPQRSGGYTL